MRTATALAGVAGVAVLGLGLAVVPAPTAPSGPALGAVAGASAPLSVEIESLGIRPRVHQAARAAAVPAITYHRGPVMTGTTDVYLIWYGGWAGNSATAILPDLVTSLAGSPWYGINTTYPNGTGTAVSNAIKLAGQVTDSYSLGKTLSDAGVQKVVSTAITGGKLPADASGIYVVLTSSDVKESSGFVSQYCGWHTAATIASTPVKFSFVGDPTKQGLSNCAQQSASSPNGNPGADAMASVLAHELAETVTDPLLNAWYDVTGAENADKCAWTFGTVYRAANGSQANVRLGARDFLIQRNWKAGTSQTCAMSL